RSSPRAPVRPAGTKRMAAYLPLQTVGDRVRPCPKAQTQQHARRTPEAGSGAGFAAGDIPLLGRRAVLRAARADVTPLGHLIVTSPYCRGPPGGWRDSGVEHAGKRAGSPCCSFWSLCRRCRCLYNCLDHLRLERTPARLASLFRHPARARITCDPYGLAVWVVVRQRTYFERTPLTAFASSFARGRSDFGSPTCTGLLTRAKPALHHP